MTGLSLAPNSVEPQQGDGNPVRQLQELLELTDFVRYSLAGNLRCATCGDQVGSAWDSQLEAA